MERHDGTNARGPESGAIREVMDEHAIRGLLDHLGNRSGHGETLTLTLGRAFLRDVCVAALEAGEAKRELEAVRRERDEWKAKHDTLADVSRSCIATAERERDEERHLADVRGEMLTKTERERDEARANYAFMVKRAADQKLDGYRELGARAAAAEERAERAERERDEARAHAAKVKP